MRRQSCTYPFRTVLNEQQQAFQHYLQTLFMLSRGRWHEIPISKIICLISKTELVGQLNQNYSNHIGNFYGTKQSVKILKQLRYMNFCLPTIISTPETLKLMHLYLWPQMTCNIKGQSLRGNFRKCGSGDRSFCNNELLDFGLSTDLHKTLVCMGSRSQCRFIVKEFAKTHLVEYFKEDFIYLPGKHLEY